MMQIKMQVGMSDVCAKVAIFMLIYVQTPVECRTVLRGFEYFSIIAHEQNKPYILLLVHSLDLLQKAFCLLFHDFVMVK